MTVTLYHTHLLYIYITHNIKCHDGIVICFAITLEFIIKLACALFEDMDPIWLRTMWEDRGTARADMIEILISLALFKLRFGLRFVDLFLEQYLILSYGLYPYLMIV